MGAGMRENTEGNGARGGKHGNDVNIERMHEILNNILI